MQISEYVSLGHPDKTADYISSYLLDRYIEKDPNTKFAVEVQIKGADVNLAGEISSKAKFTNKQIERFVKQAVADIGYTKAYQKKFGKENTICDKDIKVHTYISAQSPDIAKGLNGWGDQGIFFGYAYPDKSTDYLQPAQHLAKTICEQLLKEDSFGKDLKVLTVLTENKKVKKVIIAAPVSPCQSQKSKVITDLLDCKVDLIFNGTGEYTKHGSIADCGTTGRKLAVDFYGGACKIGGGSPWTKDGSKADLTLNLYARYLALKFLKDNGLTVPVFCDIACAIGQQEINISIHNGEGIIFKEYTEKCSPKALIKKFGLNKPIYAALCKNGLFSRIKVK